MKNSIVLSVSLLLAGVSANAATIEMNVHGLVCGYCAQGVEKSLRKHPATRDVVVSLENKLVVVSTRKGEDISDAELHKAITDAGYSLKGIKRTGRSMDEVRSQVARMAR
jgi:copper chaperone CopZ